MSAHLYQLRVVEEHAQLRERIADLCSFLKTATCMELPRQERIELHEQLHWMNGYAETLARRLRLYGRQPEHDAQQLKLFVPVDPAPNMPSDAALLVALGPCGK